MAVAALADRVFGCTMPTTVTAFPMGTVWWPVYMAGDEEMDRPDRAAMNGGPSAGAHGEFRQPSLAGHLPNTHPPAGIASSGTIARTIGRKEWEEARTGGRSATVREPHQPDSLTGRFRNRRGRPRGSFSRIAVAAETPTSGIQPLTAPGHSRPRGLLRRAMTASGTKASEGQSALARQRHTQAPGNTRCTSRKPACHLNTAPRRTMLPSHRTSPRQNLKLRTLPNRTAEATLPGGIQARDRITRTKIGRGFLVV